MNLILSFSNTHFMLYNCFLQFTWHEFLNVLFILYKINLFAHKYFLTVYLCLLYIRHSKPPWYRPHHKRTTNIYIKHTVCVYIYIIQNIQNKQELDVQASIVQCLPHSESVAPPAERLLCVFSHFVSVLSCFASLLLFYILVCVLFCGLFRVSL